MTTLSSLCRLIHHGIFYNLHHQHVSIITVFSGFLGGRFYLHLVLELNRTTIKLVHPKPSSLNVVRFLHPAHHSVPCDLAWTALSPVGLGSVVFTMVLALEHRRGVHCER